MKRRSLIIDCDPGQDDAIALLLALSAPEQLDLLGITTVAGNVTLDKTQRNARIVCEWAGRPEIGVYAGCERPLFRTPVSARSVHGDEGLHGPRLHEPAMPLQARNAVTYLIETLATRAEPLTLCTLGPLTNVALALAQAPSLATRIQEIVVMGGAMSEGGNVTPCAEFNFYADPHAARIVLASGIPVTLVPLDLTHQVLASAERVQRLAAAGTQAARRCTEIIASYGHAASRRFGAGGAPMHDPCVIAYLLAPQLFSGRLVNVVVETSSALCMGASVVDWWGITGRRPNARYLQSVQVDAVFELLGAGMARLP